MDPEQQNIQEQRNQLYSSTLQVCKGEYKEIEKEVKKLGKRLRALTTAVRGLGDLTNNDITDTLGMFGLGTVVSTEEDRENSRKFNKGNKK